MIPEITVGSVMFYSTLSFLVLVLSYLAEKSNNLLPVITLTSIFCFVAGFRNISVGRDTEEYVRILINAHNGILYRKDPGFSILCRILMVFNNYSICFIFFSIIIYGFIVARLWELRKYASFCVSCVSFYSFYYFETLNIMRQFCAIAIIFWATRYIERKDYIKFIGCLTFATLCFHKSAIIGCTFFIFELIFWKSLSKWNKFFLTIGLLSGVVFGGALLPKLLVYTQQYKHYFYVKKENIGLRVPALIIILLFSLLVLERKKTLFALLKIKKDSNFEQLRSYTILYYIVGVGLSAIGYFYDVTQRIGYYFILYVFVYFGMLFKSSKQKYKMKTKIFQEVMIIGVVSYVLLGYLIKNNGSFHHPYIFVWH